MDDEAVKQLRHVTGLDQADPQGRIDVAFRPVLAGPDSLTAGYRTLHNQESRYATVALTRQREGFELWYRLLTIGDAALRAEHEFEVPDGHLPAAHLRLSLASVALATSKLALDACVVGYYTQALALLRPMIETWKSMAYATLQPLQARRWYPGDDGSAPKTPNREKMNAALAASSDYTNNLAAMGRVLNELNDHAHLSPAALPQTQSGTEGFGILGAGYDHRWCAGIVSHATLCTHLILDELRREPHYQPERWREEVNRIGKLRTSWMQREGLLPGMDNDVERTIDGG